MPLNVNNPEADALTRKFAKLVAWASRMRSSSPYAMRSIADAAPRPPGDGGAPESQARRHPQREREGALAEVFDEMWDEP